jgi:hypothetical protein
VESFAWVQGDSAAATGGDKTISAVARHAARLKIMRLRIDGYYLCSRVRGATLAASAHICDVGAGARRSLFCEGQGEQAHTLLRSTDGKAFKGR